MSRHFFLRNRNLTIILLFFLFLTILFFITAIMDVRRTDTLLLDMFETRGLAVIETVETVARERYDRLSLKTRFLSGPVKDITDFETGFRVREMAIAQLADSAKKLDYTYGGQLPSAEALGTLSNDIPVTGIFFLDEAGNILAGDMPVPTREKSRLDHLAKSQNDVVIDVELQPSDTEKTHWIGIKRKGGAGWIFLLFTPQQLDLHVSGIIFQEVVREIGRQKGVRYLFLVDSGGRVIAGTGETDVIDLEKIVTASGGLSPGSDRVNPQVRRDGYVLDVYSRLKTDLPLSITGIAGIDITSVEKIAKRNKIHSFVFTGIMICSAGLVFFLFYHVQARYLDRLQTLNRQLVRAQRLSSLGRLAAGVAHEIRNPLNAVSMAMQRIFREFTPDDPRGKQQFSHLVSIVRDEILRLDRIVETFIEPARIKPDTFMPYALADFLGPVVSLAREAAAPKEIDIVFNTPAADLAVAMDEARLRQAVWNLIKNAVESIPENGTITVTAVARNKKQVEIQIQDTGTGIDEEAARRILEFEFTTKEKGLGLGLPIAQEIILAHAGRMEIDSDPGIGTTIRVILPRHAQSGPTP